MRKALSVAENGPDVPAKSKADGWPRKIRTTMEPDRDIEVDEAEHTELSRLGLIKGGK